MKKMKKLFAVILSLAMVLGMSLVAFADETSATITVAGVEGKTDQDQVTLSYIQAIKPDRNAQNGWSFTTEDIAKAYLAGFGKLDEYESKNKDEEKETLKQDIINQLITARKTSNDSEGKANSDEIGKALSNVAALSSAAWTTLSSGTNSWTVTGVNAAGIYVVKALQNGYTYNNMAAYVGFDDASTAYPTLKDVTLNAKRAEISLDKTGDPDRVSAVGEEVEYTITTIVPFIDPNATNTTYWITDMITGAEYVLNTSKKVDGTVQISTAEGKKEDITDANNSKVTITPENNMSLTIRKEDGTIETKTGKGFSINLSHLINPQNSNAGKTIEVKYKAKVTELKVDNTAAAGHYSNNGYDSEYGKDDEKVYTGEITLYKTDDGTPSSPLADAGFEVTNNGQVVYFKKDSSGVYTHVRTSDIPQDINWGTNREVTVEISKADGTKENITLVKEVFTTTDGIVKVQGLDVGTYIFTEKTAPEGYSINGNTVQGTLEITTEGTNANGEIIENNRTVAKQILVQTEDEEHMTVKDTKLSKLPSTGGIGTTIFTIGGCAIMVIAAGLFFASRRKSTDAK